MGETEKPAVTTEIKEPEEAELMAMDHDKLVAMFLRLVEAKNYLQLQLMSIVMGNERNIALLHHLNNQLKAKDVFIETVLDVIGWDKLPDGMELYSGDDYVLFWEDDNNVPKADFSKKWNDETPTTA